jgi:hypothetical protein
VIVAADAFWQLPVPGVLLVQQVNGLPTEMQRLF